MRLNAISKYGMSAVYILVDYLKFEIIKEDGLVFKHTFAAGNGLNLKNGDFFKISIEVYTGFPEI